jgi:hypothetical protein
VSDTDDISAQIDKLVAQANAGSADTPDDAAPAEQDAATTDPALQSAEALPDGDAFADQVQELLDAAVASADADADAAMATVDEADDDAPASQPTGTQHDPADDAEPAPPEPEPIVAATQANTEVETDPTPEDEPQVQVEELDPETQLIQEIDAMLAANADEALEGEFESIEQIELQHQAAFSAASAEPEAEADFDLDLEQATFEPVESEAVDPIADPDADGREGGFAGAADVAAELDASDGRELDGSMQSIEDLMAAQSPPASDPGPDPDTIDEPDTAPAAPTAAAAEQPASPGRLIGLLVKLNAPVMKLSPAHRDLVGCVAVGLLLLAAGLWIKGLFGTTAAMLLAAPLASALGVVVYFSMLKPHTPRGATASAMT